ncbi:the dimerization domain of ribosomal protein P1P2, partial [Mycena olivaceomarginata]
MCYLAAYFLLRIGISGKTSPSTADIKKFIGTVSIETDDERLGKLISELKGKSIDELIAEGSSKLASVSS